MMINLIKLIRKYKFSSVNNFRIILWISQLLKGSTLSINTKKNNVYILNCGIPRSGSTLLNLLLKELIILNIRQTDTYFDDRKSFYRYQKNYTNYTLLKTHRYFPNISKHLKNGKVIGIMTHRDIRDVVVSLIQKGWCPNFERFIREKELRSMSLSSVAYSEMKSMNIISYQELKENPLKILKKLSVLLGIDIEDKEAEEIVSRLSLNNIKLQTENLKNKGDDYILDTSTGLHNNHIKDGAIGKWRNILPEKQIKMINSEAEEYIKKYNYEL